MTTPGELFQHGQLQNALDAALTQVKAHPTDVGKRIVLCELLCFAGDYDRAEKQFEVIGQQDPAAVPGVSLFRQLLRAEMARRQFFQDGRVPELIGDPSPVVRLHLEASVALREGDTAAAAQALEQVEEQRPRVRGTCNGEPFDELRDLDDLTSSFFEVFTTTGKYFWIPIDTVEMIEFRAPQSMRDLLWRSAHMIVSGGPDGEVYLPVLYVNSHASDDDQLRLGRGTDWLQDDTPGTPVRGIGQRMFLVGESEMPILQMQKLELDRG